MLGPTMENAKRKEGQISFVSLLRKRADVKRILDHYNVRNLKPNGTYLNCSCPLPGHGGPDNSPSFGMRHEPGTPWNGFYKCYKCGSGDVIKFIRAMEACSFNQAISTLKQFSFDGDMYSIGLLEKELEELNEPTETEKRREAKPTFIPSMFEDDIYIARYMVRNKSRNFDPVRVGRIIKDYSIGLAFYRELLRIIVPICNEEGDWFSFFAQNPRDNSDKLFPKKAPTGLLLFGLDKLKGKTDRVVLVEGVWDCLKVASLGIPCVASFSTSVTSEQAELLLTCFDEVYIAFDADEGGDKGEQRLVDFLFPSTTLYRVNLPEGKDPCDCSQKQFFRSLSRAEKVEFCDAVDE